MCKRRFKAESWIDLLHKPTETMIRPVFWGAESQKENLPKRLRESKTLVLVIILPMQGAFSE